MSDRLCWWVSAYDNPAEGDFVWAKSRSAARAAGDVGCDFIGIRAVRFPPGDGLAFISDRLMSENGYLPRCAVCYELVYEHEASFDKRDNAYHDQCFEQRQVP